MNLEKSQKRISKKAKKGFQGYPIVTVAYYGPNATLATKVVLGFIAEENAAPQIERFTTQGEVREDVTVQTAIIKIIDRCDAQTVSLVDGIVGCPHEEGVDYPIGEECPECQYWHGRGRASGKAAD